MTPYAAQRIRFGILAARHMLERGRLTPEQEYDLDGMVSCGWKSKYAQKSFDRERASILRRVRRRQWLRK